MYSGVEPTFWAVAVTAIRRKAVKKTESLFMGR
jgi:hypothetical protein